MLLEVQSLGALLAVPRRRLFDAERLALDATRERAAAAHACARVLDRLLAVHLTPRFRRLEAHLPSFAFRLAAGHDCLCGFYMCGHQKKNPMHPVNPFCPVHAKDP